MCPAEEALLTCLYCAKCSAHRTRYQPMESTVALSAQQGSRELDLHAFYVGIPVPLVTRLAAVMSVYKPIPK